MKQIYKLLISISIISILALAPALVIDRVSAAAGSDRLNPGESLKIGQYLISQDGQYKLIMQGDGNLVLYDSAMKPLWATGTNGKPVSYAIMQGDGNFVLYDTNNKPLWDTKTWGHAGAWLILQNGGNVVVYDLNGGQLWTTATGGVISVPAVRYTSLLGIQERYYVCWYTCEDYLQIPITVEIRNSQLQPEQNVKVQIKIVEAANWNNVKYDETKYTDKNGQAIFGYSERYPYGTHSITNPNWDYADNKDYLVQAWIVNDAGYGTYMEKKFQVWAD